ncbi:MAG TPA: ferredoxin--NADP reductase [Micromonosporaceae bacterium]|nr:ferredoxin--NADP reductase [Micromonosporaceae bacterium]
MNEPPRYHRLLVTDVVDETPDTRSLVLSVPPPLATEFAYRPGQYLTVRVPHDGHGSVARCYSLSSSPQTDRDLKITVKRVVDGHGSNWICDRVRPGAVLDISSPAGNFTPSTLDSDLLLLAGGSGITPVISILKAALVDGRGHVFLGYANRDEGSVIFAEELRRLELRYADRLRVAHWLDTVHGPPTVDRMKELIREYARRDAFVCGPDPYMTVVCQALHQLGTPGRQVHVERFTTPEPPASAPAPGNRVATVEVELDGATHRLPWPASVRLLDVLIDAGLNPPFSCRQGICGACACRIVRGTVELVHNEVLEDEDFADGYTLACQALPRSDTVSVTYS